MDKHVDPAKLASIAEKVQALLNKTVENGATVEEAASAAAMAQRLMFKYNLELQDLAGTEPDEYVREQHPLGAKNGVPVRWRRELFHALADFNFCKALHYTMGEPRVVVIGRPHDVQMVQRLYDHLSKALELMARTDWARLGGNRRVEWLGFLNNYGVGAAVVVRRRLEAEAVSMARESERSMALVVRSEEGIKDALSRWFPNARAAKTPFLTTASSARDLALRMGAEAGRRVGLRPVSGELGE